MLKLTNITKTFAPGTVNQKTALCGIDLHLAPGDFVTVLGSNGAGKSTLFSAIAGSIPFTDVPDGQWYSDAVAWAYQQGIVNGMTATTFCPTLDITREQTATILMRDTAKSGGDVSARAPLSAFPDAENVSGYALEAMQWAVAAKVINGVASGGVNYLRPGENATRAQIATLLQNYLENVA